LFCFWGTRNLLFHIFSQPKTSPSPPFLLNNPCPLQNPYLFSMVFFPFFCFLRGFFFLPTGGPHISLVAAPSFPKKQPALFFPFAKKSVLSPKNTKPKKTISSTTPQPKNRETQKKNFKGKSLLFYFWGFKLGAQNPLWGEHAFLLGELFFLLGFFSLILWFGGHFFR